MTEKPTPDMTGEHRGPIWTLTHIACIIAAVFAVKLGFDWLTARIHLLEADRASTAMTGLIIVILLGYAILIAIPFVPGVEIGAAILMIQGADAAPLVYLATVLGMSFAFLVGQYLSLDWLSGRCDALRLTRLCLLIHRIKGRSREERLASLEARLPRWLAPLVVKYRYLTVAIIINTPGSIAIGGGGGIMLVAGLSRLFRTGLMLLTIALAILPIPLAVWLMGVDILP